MTTFEVGIRIFAGTLVLPLAGSHRVVGQAHLLMESVHVQLTNKRSIVIVLEEFGNQSLGEFVFVQHDEGISVIGPSYKIGIFRLVEKTKTTAVRIVFTKHISVVAYLLNFCTKGGICFLFACASLFATNARR